MNNNSHTLAQPFNIDDIVYCLAFTKEDPTISYLCRGKITKLPKEDSKVYRIQIIAVADRSLGQSPTDNQRSLIGRAINKRAYEIYSKVHHWLLPTKWLETLDNETKTSR